MSRALVVDMYMFSRVWFLHWSSHRYQMKWNPATLILFPASRFMEMDYTARIPSPSPWRIQLSGLVLSRRCIPVRSSTVTIVLHGSDHWLPNEDFIVWKAWRFFWLAVG
jgi:hypothetical protein